MPAIVLYLIKLSCSLGLIWLFYRLVLHNLTFYTLNRWYLLGYTLLSFLMPLVNIGPIRGENPALQPVIIQYIPVIGNPVPAITTIANHTTHWNAWTGMLLLFALGSFFLLLRFLVRCYSLRELRRGAELLEKGPIDIYRIRESISPFSFGNAIYINAGEHSEKEWEEIILHEYVHIRQHHTLDILFGELLVIVNWFNPFAWLIRHSIRQNLEFIADRAVIDNGFDAKGYQYHLLKVVGQSRYKLANNFNFSSLKKRIIMMNKLRSAKLHLIRFLFILPLLAVLLVAFRDRIPAFQSGKDLFVNVAGIVIDLPDRTPMAGVSVIEKTTNTKTITDAQGYYKLSIPVKGNAPHVRIQYSKPGYEGTSFERSWPLLKQNTGLCDVGLLSLPHAPMKEGFMDIPNSRNDLPADPGYHDALKNLKLVLQENDEMNSFLAVQKAHAGIALWYTTEDNQKRILIHTDGTIERYGYPGTPSLAQMGKEYGGLPGFMTSIGHPGNNGYLSRWAVISAMAEKEFHTSAPGVRAIIFPGDSRVIVVPASGKPRIYDMDSDDPSERPAFEALYGPLPACVPASPTARRYIQPVTVDRKPTDTVPRKLVTTRAGTHNSTFRQDTSPMPPGPTVYIIDGNVVDSNAFASLDTNDIRMVTIPRPGVVVVQTKSTTWPHVVLETKDSEGKPMKIIADSLHTPEGDIHAENNVPETPHTQPGPSTNAIHIRPSQSSAGASILAQMLSGDPGHRPLFILNGIVVDQSTLTGLNPDDITSINVINPKAAKAIYGDRAINGAIGISAKEPGQRASPAPQN